MPTLLSIPVDAAYHAVCALAGALSPMFGGLATAAAIVLFTMAVRTLLLPLSIRATRGLAAKARLAPIVQALTKKHRGQPDRLRREVAALYQAEGTTMYAGCLPVLLQWPFWSVMYLLFRSATVNGTPNTLLSHGLLGAPLGSHWLGGAGRAASWPASGPGPGCPRPGRARRSPSCLSMCCPAAPGPRAGSRL